jgi:carboxyl-terminal processing protease
MPRFMLFRFSLFAIILFQYLNPAAYAQSSSACRQVPVLISLLNKYHYAPIVINAAVSDTICRIFYQKLDPNRLYFTKDDIAALNSYDVNLADASGKSVCKFLDASTKLYKTKLLHADSLIAHIMSKPMSLDEKDSLFVIDKRSDWFAANNLQLEKRWQQWLKYRVLYNMFQAEYDKDDRLKASLTVLMEKEEESRLKAGKKEQLKISRILDDIQGLDNVVATELLKSIAGRFDPHTEFFSPPEKQQFENALSTSTYLFGFSFVENDDGNVIIEHIIPGSAAWKSNELYKGDQLMQIKFTGGKTQDVSSANYKDVISILSAGSDEAVFTVKKPNGQLKSVKLKKEITPVDEPLTKSYILKGKQTIGYISLPDFYTDMTEKTAKGCANDMAKEIIKLQKENISGLIIDLRYNGGGSMGEALNLAGIFINEGPLCMVKNKMNAIQTHKDANRGTIYNGPLLVLINGLSASASELLSGTLQDYNRAVLVGTPTFGKSTVQELFPLDTTFDPENIINYHMPQNIGFAKITIDKFYRVTGKSHQLRGVIPDVALPPFFYEIGYKESRMPYSLPQDSISKKTAYVPLPSIHSTELTLKSRARIITDTNFQDIKHLGDSLSSINDNNYYYPLEIEQFRKKKINENAFFDKMDSLVHRASKDFTATNNLYDQEVMQMDSYLKEINSKYLKNIQNDIYIEESYRIINDLINLK